MRSFWWFRLQVLQWVQAGNISPCRRAISLLVWWLPWVITPLLLHFTGPSHAAAGLDFLLSLDVPLALAVAGATAVNARDIAARATRDDWLWPPAFRPLRLRWLSCLRWVLLVRWPAGLAISALLLAAGTDVPAADLFELLLMAGLGFTCGVAFAWTLQRSDSVSRIRRVTRPRLARGMAALSWVAWHESRERFNLQRMMILAVPAMLAAPSGALAGDVAKIVVLWLPLLFIVSVFQDAANAQGHTRRWLRQDGMTARLTWWIWRHVALVIAVIVALLWSGMTMRTTGKAG